MHIGSIDLPAPSLTLALDGGQQSILCFCQFISEGDCFMGGWVGFRDDLDAIEKRKISCLCWESDTSLVAVLSYPSSSMLR
jgi:hypothetical protein